MALKQLTLSGDGFQSEEVEVDQNQIALGPADNHDGHWTNTQEVPITSIEAVVPVTLINKLSSIEQKVDSNLEFGVYIKGHLENGRTLVVEDEIYIPQQEVTGATIDFKEDEPDATFNGVCHRHPSGCTGFSNVDATSINRNYEFSLLYVNGDIKIGVINLKCGNYRYQLPLRVTHGYVEDIDISKIVKKIPYTPKYIRSGNTVVNAQTMRPVSPTAAAYNEYKRLQQKMQKNGVLQFDSLEQLADADADDVPASWVE